jgi:hypothetical protein
MTMKRPGWDRLIDYLPIAAYLGYWFFGAFIGALVIGELRYVMLGLVTLPAVAAMVAAALKSNRRA